MFIKSTETTIQGVLNTGDDVDLEQMIDGVPLRALLEPQPATPSNVLRLRTAMRRVADESARKATDGRGDGAGGTVVKLAGEVAKLSRQELTALLTLIGHQADVGRGAVAR